MYYRLILSSFLLLMVFSCKKDDLEKDDVGLIVEQDLSFLNHEVSNLNTIKDLFISVQQIGFHDSLFKLNSLINNVSITRDSISFKDSIVVKIEYGLQNVICRDGKLKSGTLLLKFRKNKHINDSLNSTIINLIDYQSDSLIYNGILTITPNRFYNDTLSWQINSNFILKNDKSQSLIYKGQHQIRLKNTEECAYSLKLPINMEKSQFAIIGNASGTNFLTKKFISSIVDEAEFGFYCRPDTLFKEFITFTNGLVGYKMGGIFSNYVAYIDFGNGACDRVYTLKTSDYSIEEEYRR